MVMSDQGTFLTRFDDLVDGTSKCFNLGAPGGPTIFLVRRDNQVFAYRDACPHYGTTPMAWRTDQYLSADGTVIVCAAHGAQFDIATGVCTLGPALGQSLTAVPMRRTLDGELHLGLDTNANHKGDCSS